MIEPPILSLNYLSWGLGVPKDALKDLASNAVRHYHPFLLKRPGKKPRRIQGPDSRLKDVQRRIHVALLKKFDLPEYLHGGIRGRSPETNALLHLRKRYVVRLDIQDFFPSVTDRQIYSIWKERFGCSSDVAALLTALTTFRRCLPQGAPTSSALANLVLMNSDSEIHDAAAQVGASFTRLMDDLAISGDRPHELIGVAVDALRIAGFSISREKLELMPASSLQVVAGLGLNSRSPSVPRAKRDRVRAEIHQLGNRPRDGEFCKKVESIRGRIAHIVGKNPGSARSLQRYLDLVVAGESPE